MSTLNIGAAGNTVEVQCTLSTSDTSVTALLQDLTDRGIKTKR